MIIISILLIENFVQSPTGGMFFEGRIRRPMASQSFGLISIPQDVISTKRKESLMPRRIPGKYSGRGNEDAEWRCRCIGGSHPALGRHLLREGKRCVTVFGIRCVCKVTRATAHSVGALHRTFATFIRNSIVVGARGNLFRSLETGGLGHLFVRQSGFIYFRDTHHLFLWIFFNLIFLRICHVGLFHRFPNNFVCFLFFLKRRPDAVNFLANPFRIPV